MNRLLYLLVILTVVSSCRWEHNKKKFPWMRKHPRRFHKHHAFETESDIESIQKKIIESEIKMQELCNRYSNIIVTEKYGVDTYTLKYTLEETENLNITVKIIHRLIRTTVKKNNTNALIFEDLKVFPAIVKPEEATWTMEDKDLTIRIRHKVQFGIESTTVCEAINTEAINVQEAVEGKIDVRIGDNNPLFTYRELITNEKN